MKVITLLVLVFSTFVDIQGKYFSSESDNFYVAIPKSVFRHEVFTLYISNSANRSVLAQVRTTFRSFNPWMIIAPGSTHTLRLPSYFEMQGSSDYNKGIRIYTLRSGRTISVSIMRHALASTFSAEYLALPPVTYPNITEYVYYVASYQWNNRVLTNYSSIVVLIGTQENTTVVITPVQHVEIPQHFRNPSYKWSSVDPGESYSFKMDAMETAHFENYYDLTGSKIMSNKPLTVIGSHECTDVPVGRGFCDAIVEQFPPTVTWGRFFLVTALHSRLTGERYRVIAKAGATAVKINCVNSSLPEFGHATLFLNDTGQVREFELGKDRYCSIMANKPILLVQYSQGYSMDNVGDPFMTVIPPVLQYRSGPVMVYSPRAFYNHITITISPEDFGNGRNVYINNTIVTNWRPIYCGRSSVCGYGARRSVPIGTHKVRHALHQAKFFVMSYGFEYHDGYGSSAGVELQHIADICQHGEVRLTPTNESIVEDAQEGRVEVCLDGVWNRICGSNSWSATDAIVVCRQILAPDNVMGVSVSQVESSINATWHYSIGGVDCMGTENQLVDCKWSTDNIADDISVCPYATIKCYSKVNVSVNLSPSSPLPHFVRNPATLDCMATTSPPLTKEMSLKVMWRKNGEYIPQYSQNDTYRIHPHVEMNKNETSKSWFMSSLTMAALKMEDVGSYECLAMVMLTGSGRPLTLPTMKSFNLSIFEPQSVLFQLKLSGVGMCRQWLLKFDSPVNKGKEISSHVSHHLRTSCTNCSITRHIIADATFRCFATDSNHVTYRAKLYDTGDGILPTMVDILRAWVKGGPLLAVKGLILAVDPTCVVVIESLGDPECVGRQDIPLVTTVATTNADITTTSAVPPTTRRPVTTHATTEATSIHIPESPTPADSVATTISTTTDDVFLLPDQNSHRCSNQTHKPQLLDSHATYIISAMALVVTVFIVAMTTIVVVLICVKHSYNKSYNSKAMSTASIMMSFDEPVEEHSLKSEIPRLDSTSSLNSTKLSLKSRDQQSWQTGNGFEGGFEEKEFLKIETQSTKCYNSSKEKEALKLEAERKWHSDSKEKLDDEVSSMKINLENESAIKQPSHHSQKK